MRDKQMSKFISIVAPVYNEEETIYEFNKRVTQVLKNLKDDGYDYEIIYVNDGSQDHSLEILRELRQKDPDHIKIIDFSRNFGHQLAITAGIDFASGAAVVIMDSDLQDPPELIPKMVVKWQEGFDVVYAVRKQRKAETFFKKITASYFYHILRKISKINIPRNTGDFRLIDCRVVYSLRKVKERHRFMRGLVSWTGFRQIGIEYIREKRFAGKTKYPVYKMVIFALDGITSFSKTPLQISSYLGFFVSFLSFMYIIINLYLKLFTDLPVRGWTSLIVLICFLGGLQMMFIGIIGEYIGRIYDEVKQRPLYIIKRTEGFSMDHSPE
jgi:dolichol-phosphate mannosyltransferase